MSAQTDRPQVLRPWRFGYVVVQVPDVEATIGLLTRYFQVEPDVLPDGRRCVRGATDSHWVVLEEGPRKHLVRLAFEVADRADLDAFAKRLSDRGVPTAVGSDRAAGIGDYVRFDDPDGNPIELYHSMTQMPLPAPRRSIQATNLLHTVLLVPDVPASFAFYSELLGFRASDWVEDSAVFMHIANGFHHSLALIRSSDDHGLDHICFLMNSLDDVMRLRARSMTDGIDARADVKRHAPSGSVSYYITDSTSGLVLEACWDHLRIQDSDHHQARVLPKRPETGNVWLANDDGPSTDALDGPLAST